MCQACVDEGRMTAEELATAVARGDPSAIALGSLEPKDFSKALASVTVSAMLAGMAPDRALAVAVLVAKDYVRVRGLAEDQLTTILNDMDKV